MNKKAMKAIKKHVKDNNIIDNRIVSAIQGTVRKKNPIKYVKQLYKTYTTDERRKFKVAVNEE